MATFTPSGAAALVSAKRAARSVVDLRTAAAATTMTIMLQVPKVLSSRFHTTVRTSSEPPAKRQRTSEDVDGQASGGGGCSSTHAQRTIYRTFCTQQQAFDFWDAQQPHTHLLRAFAVEHDSSGRRSFIITTPERFWAEYRSLPHEQRNHYEVLLMHLMRAMWMI